jgi:hypothetical protein
VPARPGCVTFAGSITILFPTLACISYSFLGLPHR